MEATNTESEYGSEDQHDVNKKPEQETINNKKGEVDIELKNLGPNYSRDPENNNLVYTDPETKDQYILNSDGTDWVLKTARDNSVENQYDFDGTTYFHTNNEFFGTII